MVSGLTRIGSMFANHRQFVVAEQSTATCSTHGECQQTKYQFGCVTKCTYCEHEQQRIADEKAAQLRGVADRKSKLIDELIGNSGIPMRFLGKTLKSYQVSCKE